MDAVLSFLAGSLAVVAAAAVLAAAVVLASSLTARVAFEPDGTRVYLGLGWAGVDIDYANRRRRWRLFGRTPFGSRPLEDGEPDEDKGAGDGARAGWRAARPWFGLLRDCAGPVLRFLRDLLRGLRLEELRGHVRAGFDDPAWTGCAVGAHAALAGAVPVVRRLEWEADWTGASFRARGRIALALPVWRLASALVLLAWRLPLRRVWRATRRSRERSE